MMSLQRVVEGRHDRNRAGQHRDHEHRQHQTRVRCTWCPRPQQLHFPPVSEGDQSNRRQQQDHPEQ
jgi:hypothetical protein